MTDAGAYRARGLGLFSAPGVQQGGQGPAGPPSGRRAAPRAPAAPSLAPQTLQRQAYRGGVKREQAGERLRPVDL